MIEPKELRIGNVVLYEGKISSVRSISEKQVMVSYNQGDKTSAIDSFTSIEPFEITDEVLLKAGFKKKHDKYPLPKGSTYYTLENEMELYATEDGFQFMVEDERGEADNSVNIIFRSFHRLQNFYFEKTDSELELK